MWARIKAAMGLLVLLAVAWIGYHLLKGQLAVEIYRQQLAAVVQEYQQLRDVYNEAVRRTAVTELLVQEDGQVCVTIRTAQGQVKTIPTPYRADREIYVDYVVLDGRLWIRRVFDDATPPGQGVLIDPELGQIDWDAPHAAHGKAAYRRLDKGRWVVSVTGDGSLGLKRLEGDEPSVLSPPPQVRDYPQIEAQVQAQMETIGPLDVLKQLTGG
ncbi:MAG TPA: hypothetical protein VF184_09465 [Phycisphaeraceae bacterium]